MRFAPTAFASIVAILSLIPERSKAQKKHEPVLEAGPHAGRHFIDDEYFFGLQVRVSPSDSPLSVDVHVSRYPTDEFLNRTATSGFVSWDLSETKEVAFSGGLGLEYWYERFEFGDRTVTGTYTLYGVHLEARIRVHDSIYPVFEARLMGLEDVTVALKAGVRVRII